MGVDIAGCNKCNEKMIFTYFRKQHPDLWRYGTWYELCGVMAIRIRIPNVGIIRYEALTDTIYWEKYWEDKKRLKLEEREQRPDLYQRFLIEINKYQRETGVTQNQIAEKSGISRQSISKYLTGARIPKTSTMKQISKALGLDI